MTTAALLCPPLAACLRDPPRAASLQSTRGSTAKWATPSTPRAAALVLNRPRRGDKLVLPLVTIIVANAEVTGLTV